MTAVEKARKILNPKKLKLPLRPPVVAIEVEEYEDSQGEDSLEVYVVLGEDTTDEDITGEAVLDIKTKIHDELLAQGIREFPYIHLAKRSELESSDTD